MKRSMTRFIGYLCVILAPLLTISPAYAADPNSYLDGIVHQMRIAWPQNRTITIVFHGHSVPAGYFKTPVVDTFNAYPHLVHRALKDCYPNAVINVIVTAKGGENSVDGLARFETDVLSLKPDVVIIDYALNDRQIGLKEAKKALSRMITQAKRQNVYVILMTPTGDLAVDPQDKQDSLYKHAQQIRRMAMLNEVGLADSYLRFTKYYRQHGSIEDLMSQSNHPNRKGHEMAAEELAMLFQCPLARND